VRPGSCATLPAGKWLPVGFTGDVQAGFPAEANPGIPLERFRQTQFAVELVAAGATRAAACGEHNGSLRLPFDEDKLRPPFGSARTTASGSLRVSFDRDPPVVATITPIAGGNSSLVVIRGPSCDSTGNHVRLRRGACGRPRPARTREIVLNNYYGDPESDSINQVVSRTNADVPFSTLKRGGWALEILSGQFHADALACANL
jgi:hypothetical protein